MGTNRGTKLIKSNGGGGGGSYGQQNSNFRLSFLLRRKTWKDISSFPQCSCIQML